MGFFDRQDAGNQLGQLLTQRFRGQPDVVVLALPRGGVVLGRAVADMLGVPLGLVLVRKIGHPSYVEYAIGAIAENDPPVFSESDIVTVDTGWWEQAVQAANELIDHRRTLYYGDDFHPPDIRGKSVILVDDGIATGLTMEAAVRALRQRQIARITIAVPVASPESLVKLTPLADEVIVLRDPSRFLGAVGSHYAQFAQVDDDEVRRLLRMHPAPSATINH